MAEQTFKLTAFPISPDYSATSQISEALEERRKKAEPKLSQSERGYLKRNSYGGNRSTLLGDMSIPQDQKIIHMMEKEQREMQKLQRIVELRRKEVEAAQLKDQQLKVQVNQGTEKASQFQQEREQRVRQRNNESIQRAQALDSQLQREREQYNFQKMQQRLQAEQRIKQESDEQQKRFDEHNRKKTQQFKLQLENYNRDYQSQLNYQQKKLESKHMTAVEYQKMQKQMAEEELKSQAERRQNEIERALQQNRSMMEHRKLSIDSVINKKLNQVEQHHRQRSEEQKRRDNEAELKRQHIQKTLEKAQQNELNLKLNADTQLRMKESSAHAQLTEKQQALQKYQQERERQRQQQAEAMQEHNQQLEKLRNEKLQKFEGKLNKVDEMKGSDYEAQKQIKKMKFDVELQKAQMKEELRKLNAIKPSFSKKL